MHVTRPNACTCVWSMWQEHMFTSKNFVISRDLVQFLSHSIIRDMGPLLFGYLRDMEFWKAGKYWHDKSRRFYRYFVSLNFHHALY